MMKLLQVKRDGVKIRICFLGFQILAMHDRRFNKLYQRRFSQDLSMADKRRIIETQFERNCGYKPNIRSPKGFNEKLQWLKLYYCDPLVTKCSDKYGVREYIENTIGSQYLVPLLGVWTKVEDIDWDALPEQFVLKVNWGWGQNIIVRNKSQLDVQNAINDLSKWMRPESNHYFHSFEWSYKDIQPKIIAEEYIGALEEDLPDYKFMCFNGNPALMFVVTDRFTNLSVTFHDSEFNRLPFSRSHPVKSTPIAKPAYFEEMLALSKSLSKPFPFVRCDFYEVDGKIYCGELTFYPGNGMEPFDPVDWDNRLGEMLTLPRPLMPQMTVAGFM